MILHQRGFSVHCKARSGYTPLHRSVYNGHADCADYLLEHGSDVSGGGGGEDVLSPLSVGLNRGHLDCIVVLLEHGASDGEHSQKDEDDIAPASNQTAQSTSATGRVTIREECQRRFGYDVYELARRGGILRNKQRHLNRIISILHCLILAKERSSDSIAVGMTSPECGRAAEGDNSRDFNLAKLPDTVVDALHIFETIVLPLLIDYDDTDICTP